MIMQRLKIKKFLTSFMPKALYLLKGLLVLLFSLQVAADNHTQTYYVAAEADDVVTRVLFDDIAYHFNFDVEYVNYPSFEAILNSVEAGKSDFAANVTFTAQRAERFDFSSPTNIEYTYLFSKTNGHLRNMTRIGVPGGTIYGELIKQNYPKIELITYYGSAEAMALIESGQVDGVVDAINQLKPMLLSGYDAQTLNDYISIQPVSIITPLGKNTELLSRIESYVHSAQVQKLLRESIEKYQFDIRKHALRLAVNESGLNIQRPLKVKLENVSPYTSYLPNGEVQGISADVVFKACNILLLRCELASDADETWESMYSGIRNHDIDILAPLTITEQRKNVVHFSESYYHPEAVLIKREGYKDFVYSNVSELVAERIGVIKDDFFDDLLQRMLPRKALNTYSNQDELIKALQSKHVDYIVMSRGNFNLILRESNKILPFVEDPMIGGFYKLDVAIGFSKTPLGQSLAPLFSRAIKMMDTQQIIKTYDNQPDWRATLVVEKRFASQTQWLFTTALTLLIGVALYLNKQSNSDSLTKLRNRRALYRRYHRNISGNMSFVSLDLNHFKQINDNYGYEIGDKVLKQLARRITQVWNEDAFRVGGDEFILIGEMGQEQLEDIKSYLQHFAFVDVERDVSFDVTVAIGVSTGRKGYMSLKEVLRQTDKAMYEVKHQRNIVTPIRMKSRYSE